MKTEQVNGALGRQVGREKDDIKEQLVKEGFKFSFAWSYEESRLILARMSTASLNAMVRHVSGEERYMIDDYTDFFEKAIEDEKQDRDIEAILLGEQDD